MLNDEVIQQVYRDIFNSDANKRDFKEILALALRHGVRQPRNGHCEIIYSECNTVTTQYQSSPRYDGEVPFQYRADPSLAKMGQKRKCRAGARSLDQGADDSHAGRD